MTDRAPLTPANCELRDFRRMFIDIPRLSGSEFDATPSDAAWRAGFNLWMTAWHSVPAASLDDHEASLCKAAGLGRDLRTWRQVREDAMRGYDRAVQAARRTALPHVEALAQECAAGLYRRMGLPTLELACIREAADRYGRWGAAAKVRQLARRHPSLALEPGEAAVPDAPRGFDGVDLASLLETLRAVSDQSGVEQLTTTLLTLVLEHAGASRGLLILARGERLRVEASLALMDVIRMDEMRRLRICEADDCAGLILDLSRNGSKRFCSARCGSRMNMIAFRKRKGAGAQG